MPSRKGKGRQSLGFGSKLQRAQFHQDWQSRLQEDYYAQRAQRHKQTTRQRVKDEKSHIQLTSTSTSTSTSSSGEGRRRACQSSLLRRLIAERQYWDRLEDRSWIYLHHGQQQQQRLASTSTGSAGTTGSSTSGSQRMLNDRLQDQSPPGWLIFHTTQSDEADPFAQEFLIGTSSVPSLQSLALAQLAQSLPDYVQELGVPQMTDYLSILPGPALTVLSVTVSQLGLYTNQICQVIGRQSQLTRFSLVACPQCEETDPSWKELQPNQAIQALLLQPCSSDNNTPLVVPILQSPTMVPESWEELDDSDDQDQDDIYTSSIPPPSSPISILQSHRATTTSRQQQQLERLELANLPHLQVHVLQQLLQANASTLTHLGLCGSLSSQTGPDVLWQLAQLAPNLRVLDVSGNASWVTEPVVRSVYDSYRALWESRDTVPQQQSQQQLLIIKATGCLSRSGQILMEMEFGTLF